MLVVLWCCDIRRCAMLSIDALLMVVLLELLLACWRVLRQAVAIGRRMARDTMRVMFVFFMVVLIYYKACASESRNKLVCLYRAQPGFAVLTAKVTLLEKVCNRG